MPQTVPFTVACKKKKNLRVCVRAFFIMNCLTIFHNILALMKKALGSFETRRTSYPCTRRTVPEGSNPREHHCESSKTGKCQMQR